MKKLLCIIVDGLLVVKLSPVRMPVFWRISPAGALSAGR